MARPKVHDEELRGRLLERAATIVSENGVSQLSLRALATAESTSTSAVYSLFGGKPDLLGALFVRANQSFGAAQSAAVHGDDPLTDLKRLGRAYRDWALANPHLFRVIFGGTLGGFQPSEADMAAAFATIQPLHVVIDRAVVAGILHGATELIGLSAWATVHGLVSLSLGCGVDISGSTGARLFDEVLDGMIRGWAALGS